MKRPITHIHVMIIGILLLLAGILISIYPDAVSANVCGDGRINCASWQTGAVYCDANGVRVLYSIDGDPREGLEAFFVRTSDIPSVNPAVNIEIVRTNDDYTLHRLTDGRLQFTAPGLEDGSVYDYRFTYPDCPPAGEGMSQEFLVISGTSFVITGTPAPSSTVGPSPTPSPITPEPDTPTPVALTRTPVPTNTPAPTSTPTDIPPPYAPSISCTMPGEFVMSWNHGGTPSGTTLSYYVYTLPAGYANTGTLNWGDSMTGNYNNTSSYSIYVSYQIDGGATEFLYYYHCPGA